MIIKNEGKVKMVLFKNSEFVKTIKEPEVLLHEFPSVSSPTIVSLNFGELVTVHEKRWEWEFVTCKRSSGMVFKGWVKSALLEEGGVLHN